MCIENNITNTFTLIKDINNKRNNSIISSEEEQEEEENINELPEIMNRFKTILENIDKLKDGEDRKLLGELIQLHLVIGDIEWQYDQLHEIVRKAIQSIDVEN
ncbi:hypothetical protein UT300007_27330 [Clostridium sp. CTA-7]